jgi:hypothetical protein
MVTSNLKCKAMYTKQQMLVFPCSVGKEMFSILCVSSLIVILTITRYVTAIWLNEYTYIIQKTAR